MRRFRSTHFVLIAAVAAIALAAAPVGAAKRHKASSSVAAPHALAPATGASVQALPFFSWKRVSRATSYDFQLAADAGFHTIVPDGAVQTKNSFATVDKSLADGTYYWRIRAVDANGSAGSWAPARTLVKAWTETPQLLGPVGGQHVVYPTTPLVLRWSAVPHAYKYRVALATDVQLGSSVLPSAAQSQLQTAATAYSVPVSLAPGVYYWAITPIDNEGHPGTRSAVGSFVSDWPSSVPVHAVTDLAPQNGAQPGQVFQPELSWGPVAGAARYEVEIGTSSDFAPGSKVCCDQAVLGTSMQPTHTLPNAKTFYWRVRAVDVDGNPGTWSTGASFTEIFDPAHGPGTPVTVDNLRLGDNDGDLTVGATTAAPVVRWADVPGASSYEVQMGPYQGGGCDYSPATTTESWDVRTATTAFNPLAPNRTSSPTPAGAAYSQLVGLDGGKSMVSGHAYCVRVRARSDRDVKTGEVVSGWTDLGAPSFTYQSPTPQPPRSPLQAVAGDYHAVGSVLGAPLFTWDAIPGALSYWVIVAKDELLTNVVDVALTKIPAYAPRSGTGQPKTYPDTTDAYYWAVVPAANADGSGTSGSDTDDAPQAFHTIARPPAGPPAPSVSMPSPGVQPRFAWPAVVGARSYQIQVSQDPSFGALVDDVTTDSTAYTSSSTYPADSTLYWRVRANDETNIGLSWASGPTVARALSAPSTGTGNPTAGSTIPVFTWSSVPGATSYDVHFEDLRQGAPQDFNVRSTAFAPTKFTGVGVVHWSVRANFPKVPSGEVHGPYSAPSAFTRLAPPPANVHAANPRSAVVVSWDPAPQARRYHVDISASNAFTRILDSGMTDSTSFAPLLTSPAYAAGGTLYWRVASVDEDGGFGGFVTGKFALPRGLRVSATGSLRKGAKGKITVTVTSAAGRPVKSAKVKASGGGVHASRRTGRKGTVVLSVRPRRRGTITLSVSRSGYTSGSAKVTVG